jgi:glucokinase
MRCAIGLDLGGSSAKVALVADTGEVQAEDYVAIQAMSDPEAVLKPVGAVVDRLRRTASGRGLPVVAVGCGFSGYLDDTRTKVEINNTAALDGFALEAWLRARFGMPVSVDNDACVAAFAETRLHPAASKQRILFVTIGSGIGVVLVVDGTVLRVMKGVTGDASHLIVNYGSRERCPVGCFGCLETVASARAISRAGEQAARDGASPNLARVLGEQGAIRGIDVSRAATAGERVARDILVHAGQWLGVGLASWACTYAPELILLGGAVSQAGDEWLDSATSTMRRTGMPLFVEHLPIARARLGNRAGVIGAALMAISDADPGHQ